VNDQTLERLMIDDALGALSPDVSELLAAYTATAARDPQRQGWQRVAAMAQQALLPRAVENIPAFPIRAIRFSQLRRAAALGLSAAAALLLGLGIGMRLHSAGPGEAAPPVAQTTAQTAPPATAGGVSDIWSSRRLVAAALDRKQSAAAPWQWSSPVGQPKIGGMQ
jgi:hypothetical protein